MKAKREILNNSREIVHYLASELGERTLRKYDALQAARSFILDYTRKSGLTPVEHTYQMEGKEVSNIVVDIPGYEKPEDIIILSGHYDTVEGTPGADDNATSVAAVLEIQRLLAHYRFKKTLRFVNFTLEEPPFFGSENMGSMRYARECRERGEKIDLMAAIDMIGFACKRCQQRFPNMVDKSKYPSKGDYLAVVSFPSCSPHVFLWKRIYNSHAKKKIFDLIGPASIPGIELSDHSSFIKHKYPALLLTDTAFYRNRNYHQAGDTYETINFSFLTDNIYNIMLTLMDLGNMCELFEQEGD